MGILRWISALRRRRRTTRDLPDDILEEILSRLPVKYVVRCRVVCRRWKALTSTPVLLALQHNRSAPTLVVGPWKAGRDKVVYWFVDDWEKKITTTVRHTIRINSNFVSPRVQDLVFSCSGLLVFKEQSRRSSSSASPMLFTHYDLVNPVTKERVRLIIPGGLIYGIYFHPLLQKYCVLWGDLDPSGKHMNYKILALKTSCCWRDLQVTSVSYQPRNKIPPVIVDDVLYWMIGNRYPSNNNGIRTPPSCRECIMAFDTKGEKFSTMPCPGCLQHQYYCTKDCERYMMHLVGMDGFLCLCEQSLYEDLINIWILRKDDQSNSRMWIRWHKITTGSDACNPYRMTQYKVRPVPIMNGLLFLEWQARGYFVINFKLGTVKKIIVTGPNHELLICVIRDTHVPSLVPIGNCPSEIAMST